MKVDVLPSVPNRVEGWGDQGKMEEEQRYFVMMENNLASKPKTNLPLSLLPLPLSLRKVVLLIVSMATLPTKQLNTFFTTVSLFRALKYTGSQTCVCEGGGREREEREV